LIARLGLGLATCSLLISGCSRGGGGALDACALPHHGGGRTHVRVDGRHIEVEFEDVNGDRHQVASLPLDTARSTGVFAVVAPTGASSRPSADVIVVGPSAAESVVLSEGGTTVPAPQACALNGGLEVRAAALPTSAPSPTVDVRDHDGNLLATAAQVSLSGSAGSLGSALDDG
jgi:hypothetical protein